MHHPSNVSEQNVIVAKSETYNLKVVLKHIISIQNAHTFGEIMKVANSDDERKSIILDIFTKQIYKLNDPNFKFRSSDAQYFC